MKYSNLTAYLLKQHGRDVTLSFSEIEAIIGDPLPAKSKERSEFWANQVAGLRPQRDAWRNAGYKAFLVKGSDRVRFERSGRW